MVGHRDQSATLELEKGGRKEQQFGLQLGKTAFAIPKLAKRIFPKITLRKSIFCNNLAEGSKDGGICQLNITGNSLLHAKICENRFPNSLEKSLIF